MEERVFHVSRLPTYYKTRSESPAEESIRLCLPRPHFYENRKYKYFIRFQLHMRGGFLILRGQGDVEWGSAGSFDTEGCTRLNGTQFGTDYKVQAGNNLEGIDLRLKITIWLLLLVSMVKLYILTQTMLFYVPTLPLISSKVVLVR